MSRSLLKIRALHCLVVTLLSCSLPASIAWAQEFRAAITGLVSDPSGAAVPNADVKVTNRQTGVITSSRTNTEGIYSIPLLPIGSYGVDVSAPGFSTASQTFTLHGGDRLQIDLKLQLSTASQVTVVTADVPLLETTTGDAGMTINSYDVHDLPLLGRNPFALAQDVPGVTLPPGQAPSTSLRPFDNGGMDSFQVNGSQRFSTNYLIDGSSDTIVDNTGPANLGFVPSPDMTQEFRMQTLLFDAQYGRSGGGVISVNLKSGTNQLHGVAYDYMRNEALNANDFLDNSHGVHRGRFRWQQPGLELDGPVIVPKLINGRSKLFFMFGWEAIHTNTPSVQSITVPTDLERAGNFSQTATSNQLALAIYDPLTTVATTVSGKTSYSRTPFPNATIPASMISPVAQAVMKYIPHANNLLTNAKGQTIDTSDYYSSPNSTTDDYNSLAYKVDYVVNDNHRISAAFLYNNRLQNIGTAGFDPVAAYSYINPRINHNAHVDWSWIISPTMISSFRIGWTEHNFGLLNHTSNFDPTTLGFPLSEVLASPAPNLFPYFNIAGYQAFGNAGRGEGLINNSDTYSLREVVTKVAGKHQFSFGGEFQPMRDSRINSTPDVRFSFDTTFTELTPLAGNADQGNSFSSFLLGYPGSSASYAAVGPEPAYSDYYIAAFFQENWRLSSRISITLGLRWDTETPEIERHNRQNAGFDPTTGKVLFASDSMRGAYNADLDNFGPRAGFAYRMTSKSVLKLGYGVLYAPTFDLPTNVGYSATSTVDYSNDGGATPAASLSNPFPSGFVQPAGASANMIGQTGFSYYPNRQRQIPKSTQFTIGIDYEFPFATVLSVRYVGQNTTNLPISRNANFLPASDFALGAGTLNAKVANPYANLAPGTSLNAATVSDSQLLLPYPQYLNFNEILTNGRSNYNGLQIGLQKRLTAGLTLRLSYSYSKSLQTGYLNDQNANPVWYPTPQDVRNNLTVTGAYDLPFFLHRHNGFIKEALGGWKLNAVYIYSSGQLFQVPGSVNATGNDPQTADPTGKHQFNTCTITASGTLQNCTIDSKPAWVIIPSFTLRTVTPYFGELRVAIPQNVNLSISKAFRLRDRLELQVRGETFNLANTPQFRAPDTGVNSATFGQLTNFAQINDPRNIQFALRLRF